MVIVRPITLTDLVGVVGLNPQGDGAVRPGSAGIEGEGLRGDRDGLLSPSGDEDVEGLGPLVEDVPRAAGPAVQGEPHRNSGGKVATALVP